MMDKIWLDWQIHNPNEFYGGSVQDLESLASYKKHPTGVAPLLSVSTCYFNEGDSS